MPRRNLNASAPPQPGQRAVKVCQGCRACAVRPSTSEGPSAVTLAQKVNEAGHHPDLALRHSLREGDCAQATG